MSPLTRRTLLASGAGLSAAALLAACATPGTTSVNTQSPIPAAKSGGTVRLTYWAWLKGLDKVCAIYNKSHSDVQVDAIFIPGGNAGGYQKMYSALAAGAGPDIAQIEMRSVPEFMLVNGLVDLRRYGADDVAHLYDKTLWSQVSYTGGVYGIPQDSGPMATFYRPDLFQGIGATPPATWDDWATTAAEFRKKKVYLDCFALADSSGFAAFATQAGAQWLTPEKNGWVINMTDDATMQVARFFDKAIDDDLVTTAYGAYQPAWFAAAANGSLASVTTASWGDALIEGSPTPRASGRPHRCPSGARRASARATRAVRPRQCWPTARTRRRRSTSASG
ncbi:hypothetical protein GCM10025867_35340 [Frondihabitans sucicola]|uniref:Extracellular solute-binding protein n=1 Tax=Frondihabitans sucicola TaxID=1268041 RepID=A0ABN6Y6X3_9MICO|nr:hypothetical protein GCM10025867_35340 [Frondihabitans sucicola]